MAWDDIESMEIWGFGSTRGTSLSTGFIVRDSKGRKLAVSTRIPDGKDAKAVVDFVEARLGRRGVRARSRA